MVSSEPSISAEILNHLFAVKNMKPATAAGYRAAIADHFGQEVSKCLNLNRLIASFYWISLGSVFSPHGFD